MVQEGATISEGTLLSEGSISFTASVQDGLCAFQVELPDAISPNKLNGSADMRCLALQLKYVLLSRIK